MLKIKILGTGCPNCKKLEKETRRAVEALELQADISKVTEYTDILEYDVLSTPGLVINDQVVASGKVPSQAELASLLTDALSEP